MPCEPESPHWGRTRSRKSAHATSCKDTNSCHIPPAKLDFLSILSYTKVMSVCIPLPCWTLAGRIQRESRSWIPNCLPTSASRSQSSGRRCSCTQPRCSRIPCWTRLVIGRCIKTMLYGEHPFCIPWYHSAPVMESLMSGWIMALYRAVYWSSGLVDPVASGGTSHSSSASGGVHGSMRVPPQLLPMRPNGCGIIR